MNSAGAMPGFSGLPYPDLLRAEGLADLFAATVARVPDRIACVFGAQQLSYAALNQQAEHLAAALRRRGLGRGDFVGLWLERGLSLHIALLAIVKTGAAYVPFDADAPAGRVTDCLKDAGAKALLTDALHEALLPGDLPGCLLLRSDLLASEPSPVAVDLPDADGSRDDAGQPAGAPAASSDDPAYVIYTSGSTGTPKGVLVSQANICHFLRAAAQIYGVTEQDVVFQGASVAFDLSLEEIFLPYLTGATSWIAGRDLLNDSDSLPQILQQAGITVLDTVPTLLTLLGADVPSLRVIILGGEACPPALAERWCRPGRRLFNSYGPTEATVVATVAELQPGQPVTIGQPIPNYTCYVVDDDLRPLPPGSSGELLIGGPGVARGYLNRPALTSEKFIANPFHQDGAPHHDPVLYRTGDAVQMDDSGALHFLGRIDDQVKIRGFRIELGEIEARLSACPGVAQAAVVVRGDNGNDQLVAFLLPAPGEVPQPGEIRARLRTELPAYMIPARFEMIDALPRLISGKLDRKTLRSCPLTSSADSGAAQDEPDGPVEAVLLAAARRLFPGQTVPLTADFFLDLGGHSLLAARFVSIVRETVALTGITLQDVYDARSLRGIAQALARRGMTLDPAGRRGDGGTASGDAAADLSFPPPSRLRRLLCGLAQTLCVPVLTGFHFAPWLGVFLTYQLLSGEDHDFGTEAVTLLSTYTLLTTLNIFVSILGKWLVIGRTKPGVYPLWGVYYFRWWLSQRFLHLVNLKLLAVSPVMRWYLRALGCRVGEDAIVSDFEAGAIDLVEIGRGACLGSKTIFANAEVTGDQLRIGRVRIGADVSGGSSVVLGADCQIGEGAELGDLSAVANGQTVPDWTCWQGSPGQVSGEVQQDKLPAPAQASALRRGLLNCGYLLALLLLPPIALMPILPAFYLFDRMGEGFSGMLGLDPLYALPILAWPTGLILILVTIALIVLLRWTVLPSVRAGVYSVHSDFYLRKWIVMVATELTLETLHSLYATVYMRIWYRLMGAKIGRDSEISTDLAGRYDLTRIGEKCFIADEVILGDEVIRRGWMFLKPVEIGSRVFVGNSAVVPPGSALPDGCLIGIKSAPPDNKPVAADDVWFGIPPMKLPGRQRFDSIGANWTFTPSLARRVSRALFEACTISLPTMLAITFGTITVEMLAQAVQDNDWATGLALYCLATTAIALLMVLVSAGMKWLLMGAYGPTVKPMWSWWSLRTEAVAVMYWGLAGKTLLDILRGSPLLPWTLRLFGCRFGTGVFMDSTDITEFDCIRVGSYAAINAGASLQTHLYEDRVMKVGRIRIGAGVSIGGGSVVLYDTSVGSFARLGLQTIIMKGEEIPAHSCWQGAPATIGPHPEA